MSTTGQSIHDLSANLAEERAAAATTVNHAPTFKIFLGDGIVRMHPPGSNGATDVVLQPDGDLVVSADRVSTSRGGFVLRYDSDGSPDTTFGSGGLTADSSGGREALALLPD